MGQIFATGANITNLPLVFGLLLALIAILLLVVFFVSPKKIPRKEFMAEAWLLVKKYFWVLVGVVALQFILINLPSIVEEAVKNAYKLRESNLFVALSATLITIIISSIVQPGLIGISLKTADGGTPRFADLFSQARIALKYFCGALLYNVIVFVGLLLLVIPGVIWFLKFSFWQYALVDKNAGILESFHASSRMTAGYKKSLFVLYVYLGALNTLGIIALGVGLLATVPLTILVLARVYRKLSDASSIQLA